MTSTSSSDYKPFVHLHLHTQYSLLDGAIKIQDLVDRVSQLNQPAVAVTDHGVMFSTVQFMRAARNANVKPIIGCELYILPEGDYRDKTTRQKPNHVTILAKNKEGYLNLTKLVSEAFINGFYYKPRVDLNLLEELSEGLICLSGCLNGVLSRQILNGREDKALELGTKFRDIFGEENFYIELQNHGLQEQQIVLDPLFDIAQKLGVPPVITNDCHYLNSGDHEAHDILLCIGTGKLAKDINRMRYESKEFYIKSGDEMAEMFPGKFSEALDNTLRIADRCDFQLDSGSYHLPNYEVPREETIDSYFAKIARKGLDEKLPVIIKNIENGLVNESVEGYRKRLEQEITIIQGMGFSGYFLIVWDFIKFAKESNIPVGPGRGSGAGSLVAYSMGITGIDPIQYNLLFERFLNPERISMPDFDIDFCMRRRGEVIDYVTKKYGWKNVAQIITFGTLKAKNAIRDVGRVLDIPYGHVDKVAKMIPDELGITLDKALEDSSELKELYKADSTVKKMIDIAQRLEGLTRHASTHAAGVVIAPSPLLNYCPLFKSSKEEITTQYDMNDVEEIGLIKMDFLGLRTLTVLQDTIDAIKKDLGETIILDDIPPGDEKAYELLSSGKSCGIFQFESRGMRDLLMRYKPERLEDLSALNALYRPGPIKGGLLDEFIHRKHGRKEVEYIHPKIEEITRETYGVILYQEQVMQIASIIAGFSLGEADILRRAMGKKKKKLMDEQKTKFLAGATQRDVTREKATEIFDYIDKFSGYGFNKSHSTAYGFIAYQTAYLKAHYPQYFMASLMSSEMEDSDRIKLYMSECQDMGINVLPPDINNSELFFTVEDEAIRFSLCAVKNVGHNAVESIVKERNENGNFESLFDFCERVDLKALNKRAMESMIKAGSFDCVNSNRAQLIKTLDKAYDAGQKAMKDRISGQESLFGGNNFTSADSSETEHLYEYSVEWSEKERLANEKEILGFYLSGHPLSEYVMQLDAVRSFKIEDLENRKGVITAGGIITDLKKRPTRNGELMATFALEDESGAINTLIFPKLYNVVSRYLEEDAIVVIEGSLKKEADSVRLFATDVMPLSEHKSLEKKSISITLDFNKCDKSAIRDMLEIIKSNKGNSPVQLRIQQEGNFDIELLTDNMGIKSSNDVITQLQGVVGHANVVVNKQKNHFAIS